MATKSQTGKKPPQVPGGAPTSSENPAAEGEATVKAGSELPDQSKIDPTKISRAVLTKQGWVCPA